MNKIVIFSSIILGILISVMNILFYHKDKIVLSSNSISLILSLCVFVFMLSGRQLYLSIYILFLSYVMCTKALTLYIIKTKYNGEEVKDYSMTVFNGLVSLYLFVMIVYLIYIYLKIKISSRGLTIRKGSSRKE